MIPSALILVPALAGVLALLLRRDTHRHVLLVLAAAAHTGLTISAWMDRPPLAWGGYLRMDALGLLFLTTTSALFLLTALYATGYLRREIHGSRADLFNPDGALFSNAPEAIFVACLLFFLSSMTLVVLSHHFGLLWVGVEATTLASAPLIYFHRHRRSLAATWRYLMVCSVGIALALLGYLFLGVATDGTGPIAMTVTELMARGPSLGVPWLKAAFILYLVGFGTKMGLAPMHDWLPQAHSEAPSLVSALMSGALLNCAFLGILRVFEVCVAAGQAPFARELLVLLGLLSMAVAAISIVGQRDYKRLLAYSSVEHMGILALGVGLGASAVTGAMLHVVSHSFAKGLLFLTAGNILAAYKTRSTDAVSGVRHRLPITGALWIAGLLAITGAPPFGLFLSELSIIRSGLDGGHLIAVTLMLALLTVIFVGMAAVVLPMAQGPAAPEVRRERESLALVGPPALLLALVLALGVYIPEPVMAVLRDAASALVPGGS